MKEYINNCSKTQLINICIKYEIPYKNNYSLNKLKNHIINYIDDFNMFARIGGNYGKQIILRED